MLDFMSSINITFIIFVVILCMFCYKVISIYNTLVIVTKNVEKAWSNIGVLLKQRNDELPKLVDTCKEYMGYEQETLQQVMDARAAVQQAGDSGDVKGVNRSERKLRLGLNSLFALAENYPDLKATNSFQQLQARISSLEGQIADRREQYNEYVNINNIRVHSFPDLIVAWLLNFKDKDLLEYDESEKADVNIKSLFEKN